MTTLWETAGTMTSNKLETMNTMFVHLITDNGDEENQHHKNIRKMIEEPIYTRDDAEFTQVQIKQTIEIFNRQKETGMVWIPSVMFLRIFNNFPRQ